MTDTSPSAHLVDQFDTFAEASECARHLAKWHGVELRVARVENRWQVTCEVPMEALNRNQFEEKLRGKDAEATALREQIEELQQRLQQAENETQRFRRRVIEREAKSTSELVEDWSRSHPRTPLPVSTCESCGRPLDFCRCAG